MKLTTNDLLASQPLFHCPCSSRRTRRRRSNGLHLPINVTRKNSSLSIVALSDSDRQSRTAFSRRSILLTPPLLAAAASLFLKPSVSSASEESSSATVTSPTESAAPPVTTTTPPPAVNKEETITSRIYDATAIGEPMAMGKDKKKVWEKLMNARVVYLGEAEQVPTKDDKELELEIVRNLKNICVESERQDLQDQLNQYMDKRIDGERLKSYVTD